MVKKTKIHIFFFLMVFILAFGCGSAEKGSGGGENTGSIALNVNWQGAPGNPADTNISKAPIDCAASSVATVSAYVYDANNTLLSSGGPWSCSAHSGTISNVPAGTGRRMLIVGSDSNGIVRYCGEQTNITVSSGQTTSVSITAYDFTPSGVSAAGGNGQATISWTAVTGATSYNIYWSTTTGVTKTNGTKITGATSPYTQTGLTNGTTYYYVVTAVNSYGESVESSQVSGTPAPATVQVLVVAGGGGGGYTGTVYGGVAGGGGAGGYQYNSSYSISVGSYAVTVGTGGNGSSTNNIQGGTGENSVFGTITSFGGGGGGSVTNISGVSGGSGGGGAGNAGGGGGGGGGTSGQGYNGGNGATSGGSDVGAGGGGSSSAGQNRNIGSAVGAGTANSISGSSVTYAGGGGTCNGPGTANTGIGGCGNSFAGGSGTNGGSGIVIISYTTGALNATGGTITTLGGNTIHTFNSSGTFTVN